MTIGLHTHHLLSSPEEQRFADLWEFVGFEGHALDWLLLPEEKHRAGHFEHASERDRVVAATVVQWFGSPMGQQFLRHLGYERSGK